MKEEKVDQEGEERETDVHSIGRDIIRRIVRDRGSSGRSRSEHGASYFFRHPGGNKLALRSSQCQAQNRRSTDHSVLRQVALCHLLTFLKTKIEVEIKTLPALILVKVIGARRQPSSEYVLLDVYINGKAMEMLRPISDESFI
jgi:hypothetical protein